MGQPIVKPWLTVPVGLTGIALVAMLIVAAGRVKGRDAGPAAGQSLVEEVPDLFADPLGQDATPEPNSKDHTGNALQPERSGAAARAVSPDEAGLVEAKGGLERVAPRAPLGDIGPAAAPKPKPAQAEDLVLQRPVATAAGRLESRDRQVTIAGLDIVAADETCARDAAAAWPCGAYARTAFRSWLRGRSVTCGHPASDGAAAACRVGKQDIGAWLVSNGWARASPGGPYADLGGEAERARRGIFGEPPAALAAPASTAASALPAPPATADSLLSATQPGLAPPASAPEMNRPDAGYFPPAPKP